MQNRGVHMPPSRAHLYLKREELYDLVWAKPMQQLAKEYGVSDRALAKLCGRKQVPVPPRGYWARVSAGQKTNKPPLPAFVAKQITKDKTASDEAKTVPEKLDKHRTLTPSED